jgi:predicted RNA-binding protein YlqC (UPF0109 family)
MNEQDKLQRLIDITDTIVRGLVDNEEAVLIEGNIENYKTFLNIKVDNTEFGKVIGTDGYLVRSLRNVLRASCNKFGLPFCMPMILDPLNKRTKKYRK